MSDQKAFDPKYAALGVAVILLSVLVLVIVPNLLKKQLAALGKPNE